MIGPLSYIGGKRRLAKRIVALIPEHTTYVEPFAGGAQVFFHKPRSRIEVLNDLDGDIVNFLRICREHPHELLRTLRYLVPSRATFAQFLEQATDGLTDIQRAARFLYLQKNAFGGRVDRRNYHYAVSAPPNFNPSRLPAIIRAAAHRLRFVQLENWPYERVLERYDRPSTFFYLDPPYLGRRLYRHNLEENAFEMMAARLANIRGRFLLSINDCEAARRVFSRFDRLELRVPYTASRTVPTVRELLFGN